MTGDYRMLRGFTSYTIPDRSVVMVLKLGINSKGHAARYEK
jgi:hypothetical protein